MAKWGEGDPRWIVEERPDATNVNNWHWTEKNATPWSKDKLKSLFKDFTIAKNDFECKISDVEKMEGEATANNRKGKLIFFYEWNIVLKWKGEVDGEDVEGLVTIPNLSEENDIDEVEITITINESNDDSEKLKQFMYKVGRDKIRTQLEVYVKALKEDFAKGLILPKKDEAPKVQSNNVSKTKVEMQPIVNAPKKEDKTIGCRLDVKTINLTEKFQCTAHELFDAFSRVDMATAFTRGHVKMDFCKGGEFVFFGGNVSGKFEEIVPDKKITQTWRYKQWPAGHYSHVTLDFVQKDDHTELRVTHTMIPAGEEETTQQNWNRYYFESIKATFGFGSFLC